MVFTSSNNSLDAITTTTGANKMTLSFVDYQEENATLFEDLARETGRMFSDIANEHYESYLESIEDRDL